MSHVNSFHVIVSYKRPHLKRAMVAHFAHHPIALHPVSFFNEEFPEPWVKPTTVDETPGWVGCYNRFNQWIERGDIIDGDYYIFMSDDDGFEPGFFDELDDATADVVVTSAKRGQYRTTTGARHPASTLVAAPENMQRGKVDLMQLCLKGSVVKKIVWEDHYEADGMMAEKLASEYGDKIDYRPNVYGLFNLFEEGRYNPALIPAMPTPDPDLVRRISLYGTRSLTTFGGVYEGSYFLQQVPEEAAQLITLAKHTVPHPRLLEVGAADGGFARLLDDELACRSIRIIDADNTPERLDYREFLLPHLNNEFIGDAADAGPWLENEEEEHDLIIIDADHEYGPTRKHTEVVLPYLAPGGLVAFHDSVACEGVARYVSELKGGAQADLEHVTDIGCRLGFSVFRRKGDRPELPAFEYPHATLLYHFCPWLGRPEMIDFHVKCLSRYLHQFNKVRINIATGDGFAPPEEIEERLRPFIKTDNCKFFHTPNGDDGETTPFFEKLLPEVYPSEDVCYGHTKGAMLSPMPGGKAWAELMYAHTMQNTRAVADLLATYDCVGPFFRSPVKRGAKWHYAGTFFWFTCVDQWDGWDDHISNRFAVENWLGRFVPAERAFATIGWPFLKALTHGKQGILDRYTALPV